MSNKLNSKKMNNERLVSLSHTCPNCCKPRVYDVPAFTGGEFLVTCIDCGYQVSVSHTTEDHDTTISIKRIWNLRGGSKTEEVNL